MLYFRRFGSLEIWKLCISLVLTASRFANVAFPYVLELHTLHGSLRRFRNRCKTNRFSIFWHLLEYWAWRPESPRSHGGLCGSITLCAFYGRPIGVLSCEYILGMLNTIHWAWRLESPWSHGGPGGSIALCAFYGRPIGVVSCEQLWRLEIENLNIS